ncbi:MAG TPA: TRAP transporter fused permease subunit [Methylomirabilota bacterium]|nr:TRAP transporter fused permease subunit [Methylomirabilota bacterium]
MPVDTPGQDPTAPIPVAGVTAGPDRDALAAEALGQDLSEEQTQALIEEYETEGRAQPLGGVWRWVAGGLAVALAAYALYATRTTITTQVYRSAFLGGALCLSFLMFPVHKRWTGRVMPWDIVLAAASVVVCAYPIVNLDEFVYRAARPTETDLWMGTICIVLILEATRRTIGWILPAFAVLLLLYGRYGDVFPGQYGHRGYDLERMVGTFYITLEGIFGVPLDVAATYIILFTIYGAILEFSGAGKFFLDFSFAATGRKASGAGRTTTIAGFLLGTVSGSGVATTVTLGSVAWPMLRKAGYDKESGGAVLSAAGIGAILSPPTLGAAAFLIAEFLQISYLEVLKMATIPTILYYLSIFLMVELDARRMGTRAVAIVTLPLRTLTLRYGYHFTSLVAIVVMMTIGFTPLNAVFWATVLAVGLSFLRRETALTPTRAVRTLESGTIGTLSVAATCATAGIIVGIFTLTGLGLKMSDLIVDVAGGTLFWTVVFTGIAIWVLGLAVPVTASYIIAAAITAPALTTLGVPEPAAHMFIFYYAVLSEVSPPTALSPFAAAALTGGNPFKTMMVTWKYTLPAFIVPFMFVLNTETGVYLLALGDLGPVILATTTACLAIVALVAGVGGWIVGPASWPERALLIPAAGLLLYTGPLQDAVGLALFAAAVVLHVLRVRGAGPAALRPGV